MLKVIISGRGSKRIPRKNMEVSFGMPIIDRIIPTMKHHKLVAEIILSVDDIIFSQLYEPLAVTVFERTEKNTNDTATTDDAIQSSY